MLRAAVFSSGPCTLFWATWVGLDSVWVLTSFTELLLLNLLCLRICNQIRFYIKLIDQGLCIIKPSLRMRLFTQIYSLIWEILRFLYKVIRPLGLKVCHLVIGFFSINLFILLLFDLLLLLYRHTCVYIYTRTV